MSREHILDVAETLFGDHGLADTSFEQIADGSEFSVAAVYKLFSGKQHLLNAVMKRRFVEMKREIDEILSTQLSGLEELLALCAYFLAYYEAHPSFGRLTLRVYPANLEYLADYAQYREDTTEGTAMIARALRRGQEAGTVKDVDAVWLASLVGGLIMFHHSAESEHTEFRGGTDILAVIRDAVAPSPARA